MDANETRRVQRALLKHFLAALAYRTQKALRDAPADFGQFRARPQLRTPQELVQHMDSVLGYSRTFFRGGSYWPPTFATLAETVAHFHEVVEDLAGLLDSDAPLNAPVTEEILLQGPFSDAMTHAGQVAMLRRLHGSPVPPENFVFANISAENLSANQPEPAAPDAVWPERPE